MIPSMDEKGGVKLKVKLLNCLPGHIHEGEVSSEFDGSIFSGDVREVPMI